MSALLVLTPRPNFMNAWTHLLKPDLILGQSILALSAEHLKQQGLQGLVLDVDETLVPFGYREIDDQLHAWLTTMRAEVDIWLVSNNVSESRIGGIARSLDLPYIHFAAKPFRRKLARAVNAMNIPPVAVGMVGDRLLTDVLAGNRLGMYTILVEPMAIPGQPPRLSRIRSLENWLLDRLGYSQML